MVVIKDIPVLTGKAAERFIEMAEANMLKRGTIDFSEESEKSMRILSEWRSRTADIR